MKTISKVKGALAGTCAMNSFRLASNVADGEKLTIGNEVYEVDTSAAPGTVAAGSIRVDCSSTVAPGPAIAAFCTAINSNSRLVMAFQMPSEILCVSRLSELPRPLTCASTLAGANNRWVNTAFSGGADGFLGFQMLSRVVVLDEVALGVMRFVFPFRVNAFNAIVRTSSGTIKQWGGALSKFTIGGVNYGVALTNNATVDFVIGDVVTVFASE